MQTEKRAGRVMRNVAAVLVIILAIVALFQGFRMRGKDRMRTGKGGHISGREVCVQRRSGVDPFSWGR